MILVLQCPQYSPATLVVHYPLLVQELQETLWLLVCLQSQLDLQVQGFLNPLLYRGNPVTLQNQVPLSCQLVPGALVGPADQEHQQVLGVQYHQLNQWHLESQAAQIARMDL